MTCKTCGLASWTGCGQHVEQVLAGVPEAQRCPGHPTQRQALGGFEPASSVVAEDSAAKANRLLVSCALISLGK